MVFGLGEHALGRAGRKREGKRARYRSGRAKPRKQQVDEVVRTARNLPHRRELRSAVRMSSLAESALGRLSLAEKVTRGQQHAGEVFAQIVGRYQRVIDGPRSPRSLSLGAADSAPSADEEPAERFECPSEHADPIDRQFTIAGQVKLVREWPCGSTAEGCVCAQRRDRYMRLYEAIMERAGRRALLAVIRVAVRGEELPPQELVYLTLGLDAAKRHLGLTEPDERDYGRNAH